MNKREFVFGGGIMMKFMRLTHNDTYWNRTIHYARHCSWDIVGEHIAKMMENYRFSDWESIFIAT